MKKQLNWLTMIILSLAVSITAVLIAYSIVDIQREATSERLMDTTQLLLLEAQRLNPEELAPLADTWSNHNGQYRVTFIQKDGTVLGDSSAVDQTMENHSSRPEIMAALATGEGMDERISSTTGIPSLYAAAASHDGEILVRVALPLHELQVIEKTIISRALYIIIFTLAIALYFVNRLSQKLIKPLDRLREATHLMAGGDYSTRVAQEKHEIGALGQDFNDMAEALQQAMNKVQEQRFLLNTTLNHVVTGILAIDHEGKLLLANPLARQLFRLPKNKPANTLDPDLLRRDPELWRLLKITLQSGENQEADLNRLNLYQVTTSLLPLQHNSVQSDPANPSNQTSNGVIMAIQDMTRIKKLENLRSEFIANATHELRTPLTSIQGYIETLSSNVDLTPALRSEILAILEMESHRLSHLIDDMLTLSEIENRPQDINEKICDPAEIAQEVVTLLRPLAEQKQVHLELQATTVPCIWARSDWLQRMLINLVDNAIKYNQPGGSVMITLQPADPNRLQIIVTDTGIGISEENLKRIFERFYRVDQSRSRETGGTGLGLAIVKHMIQLYGGTIQVFSEEGKGTRFVVEMPAA